MDRPDASSSLAVAAASGATGVVPTQDDSRVRDLFNALRTGDQGVGHEAFVGAFYFLQHRTFSVFDVHDAFVSSSAASERFLSYRDFQYALLKTARAAAPADTTNSDAALLVQLLDAIHESQKETERRRMDSIRRQLTKRSVLGVLHQSMPQLVQSFQVYGTANDLTPRQQRLKIQAKHDMSLPMALDGFVDFLNAYFEYEDYFSYQAIEQLAEEVVEALNAHTPPQPADAPLLLHFPQFIELFCRVASQFHVRILEHEGAQLRKAVESCRLEFSIQVLLEKMNIRLHKDREANANTTALKQDAVREVIPPNYDASGAAIEALTLDEKEPDATDSTVMPTPSMASLLNEITALLDLGSGTAANARQPTTTNKQRPQSMLFARLPPRKSPPVASAFSSQYKPVWLEQHVDDSLLSGSSSTSRTAWDPPHVTLIREVVAPPQLPSHILKRLEYAITYQNTGQYHMALGALHTCRTLYRESRGHGVPEETEVRVFFSLMDASVYDSARRDQRALVLYLDALRAAERLPGRHAGRALVKSCLGGMLFYLNELPLARRCLEHVLAFRRHTLGDEHVDTATAMNNLACCLSQDPQGSAIEEAYLYLKTAKRIYSEQCGPAHARVEVIARNVERVLASQRAVVVDPLGAIARGEYAHVIPGSRFQIKALVPVTKDKSSSGISGKKKKKKKNGGKKKK